MLKLFLRVLVSVFFIGLLVYLVRGDVPKILAVLRGMDLVLASAALALFLSTAAVMGRRLQLIFRAESIRTGFRTCCALTFVGYFFNNFLPTSVGGDIVKAMSAARLTGEPVKSVTSVLMDRIFGLFTFVLIPAASVLFVIRRMPDPRVPATIYGALIFALACFLLLFNRNVARRFAFIESILNRVGLGPKVRRLYDGLHDFRHRKKLIAHALALSILGQSISILSLYLLALALGAQANPVYFFLLVPVVHLMSMMPSLGGLGVREWAYIIFLSPYIGREVATALGLLWFALLLVMSVIGGLIYLVRHDYHVRWKEAGAVS